MHKEVVFRDGMPELPKRITIHVTDDSGESIGTAKVYSGYLDEIWVRADVRHQGIGKQLILAAIREGATRAIAAAAEVKSILSTLGWRSADGLRFHP